MPVLTKKRRKRSERGHWLVVTYLDGRIYWCTWIQTWAGVQASRRNSQRSLDLFEARGKKGRVVVLDIERMMDFAMTEGANEIHDLYRLFEKE